MNLRRTTYTSNQRFLSLPKLQCTISPYKKKRKIGHVKNPQNLLSAQAYGVYTQNLCPIIEFNQQIKREIASLTKMMTMIVSIKVCRRLKLNLLKTHFRVTSNAANTWGTSASLQSLQWISAHDLLYALMLPSGNDAATVIAENIGALVYYQRMGQTSLSEIKSLDLTKDIYNLKLYSEQFSKIMNSTAQEIGMKNTLFCNAHGLDPSIGSQAYSTVRDICLLIKQLLNYSECLPVIRCSSYHSFVKIKSNKQVINKPVQWISTNKLQGAQNYFGGKTGQTYNAGQCLASIYQINDIKYLIIVLGCQTKEARFKETEYLYNKYVSINL